MRIRAKFVLVSIILAVIFMALPLSPLAWRPLAIAGFALVAYVLTAWALWESLDGIEWVTIVPLPALFGSAVAVFYFLLPSALLTRLLIVGIFGLGMYALLLASNIFTIARQRSIQLLRAAQAALFLFVLLASVMAYNTILSFGWQFFISSPLVGLTTFLLVLPFFWTIKLERQVSLVVRGLAVRTALTLIAATAALSFLPGELWPRSLLLMTVLYVWLGFGQAIIEERLFANTVREYLAVAIAVGLVFLAIMPWR